MKQQLPVFLLGFMASSKTTLGKKLANKLNCAFIDLDEYIEKESNRTISELFSNRGEDYFRKVESDCLQQIAANQAVISLGGGTFVNDKNRQLIKNSGTSIFLDVQPSVLLGRLRKGRQKRPLIAHLDEAALAEFVDSKLSERRPFYEEADLISKADNPTVSMLLNLLNT